MIFSTGMTWLVTQRLTHISATKTGKMVVAKNHLTAPWSFLRRRPSQTLRR